MADKSNQRFTKSLALLCLYGLISSTQAFKLASETEIHTAESSEMELGRYFNANDEPIVLSRSKKHTRLALTRRRRSGKQNQQKQMHEKSFLQLEEGLDVSACNGKDDKTFCLTMENDHDMSYMADLYIGNPPQKVRGLFDTGSSNTWILNKEVGQQSLFSYDDTVSNMCQKTDQTAAISFGIGDLSGHFYSDDLTIGEGEKAIKIKAQKFGNVEKQNGIFNGGFEAIIGMAYPALAEEGVTPVFDNMINQNLLKNNLFAFYLTQSQQNVESDITFGYYDKTRFKGDITWHPVDYQYMYGIKLDDIKINNKSLGFCGPNGKKSDCLVTVDSGTTMMAMPGWAFSLLSNKIPTMATPANCEKQSDFGNLTFVINGKDYPLLSQEWIFPPNEGNPSGLSQIENQDKSIIKLGQSFSRHSQSLAQTWSSSSFLDLGLLPKQEIRIGKSSFLSLKDYDDEEDKEEMAAISSQFTTTIADVHASTDSSIGIESSSFSDAEEGTGESTAASASSGTGIESFSESQGSKSCYGSIMQMDLAKDMFLVGDIFMRKYYSIFDRENNRVGLATAINTT